MSDDVPSSARKKTPADASPFEREQLSFLLTNSDLPTQLSDINPSLSWLPVFSQMKLVQHENQVLPWIERNLADIDAIREIVINLHFFGTDTANYLEQRLSRRLAELPPLVVQSWRLLLRHMRGASTLSDWFEIAPQLKQGNHSAVLLERLASTLRPNLKISKRFGNVEEKVQRPSDIMTIEFEVPEGMSSDDVLAAWPENASAPTDKDLLFRLTTTLESALAEATESGVEREGMWSISDTDVPSVADHPQNEYRAGFLVVVRIMADIWSRLVAKSQGDALALTERWRTSTFRLVRRLALFALANPSTPNADAADLLATLSDAELFTTNSTVEAFRLIRARWKGFSQAQQEAVLERLRNGPSRTLFREGADVEKGIDRFRFDYLANMVRDGLAIGDEGAKVLVEIRKRRPEWLERPAEQAGFHVWHESGEGDIEADQGGLDSVPDEQIVATAQKLDADAPFHDSNVWQNLVAVDPDRALRGLRAAARRGEWPMAYWERLLWSRTPYKDQASEASIAELLLNWPAETFSNVVGSASFWLRDRAQSMQSAELWPLWDRILQSSLSEDRGEANE